MQVLAALVAVAAAVPLEDTMDVKEAKAMFYKAFEEAEMGKLAEKQEMQIPNSKTCNPHVISFLIAVMTFTGLGYITSHRLCESEMKRLRSPSCSRLENAIFSTHIHATDGK